MNMMIKSQLKDEQYRWIILGTLFSLHVLTSVGQFSLPPLLPFIKEELGLNYTQVGLFTSSFFLGVAATATFAGWTVDYLGIKKMVILGTMIMGLFILLASWMPSFWLMAGFLLLAGIAYSGVTPASNKATICWFHDRLRATAMGVKQTGINGGGFLVAFIVPPLALNFGWHVALSVAGILVLVGGIVVLMFYRDCDQGTPAPPPLREWRHQIMRVVSNRNVLLLGLDGFFRVGVQNSFLTYLILYLQKVFQLPMITTGFFFALAHASGAMGRILWGVISDRLFGGKRKGVYLIIPLAAGTSLVIFGHLTPSSPVWLITLLVALLGATAAGHQGVGLSLVSEVVGKEMTGVATGFTQSLSFLGVFLIVPFFGLLVDTFETYSIAWIGLALFSFTASGLVFFVKEKIKETLPPVLPGWDHRAEEGS